MKKFKVTLFSKQMPMAKFIVEAVDEEALQWVMYNFYPDTNWDYKVISRKQPDTADK